MVEMRGIVPYAAGLVAALALAACSGGDPAPAQTVSTPSVTTSSSSPTSSAPSASVTPTTAEDPVLAKIPKEARAETTQGAEAFAIYYMKQVNRAFTQADSGAITALSKPGCNICSRFAEGADAMKKEGVHHEGLSIEPTSSAVQRSTTKSQQVLVWTTQHPVPVVDAQGRRIRTTKGSDGVFLATLVYEGRWWISNLQVAK